MKMKRILSLALAVILALSMLPVPPHVHAEGTGTPAVLTAADQQVNLDANTAYQFTFTPDAPGDYILKINSSSISGKNIVDDSYMEVSAVDAAGAAVDVYSRHAKGDAFCYAFEGMTAQTYTITVTSKVDTVSAAVSMNARIKLDGISPDVAVLGGTVGQTLVTCVRPDSLYAYDLQYTWTSSDPTIVEVVNTTVNTNDDGHRTYESDVHLSLVSVGTATITVTATDDDDTTNKHSCTFDVTVNAANPGNGPLSVGSTQVAVPADEMTYVSFTPEESGEYWIGQSLSSSVSLEKISGLTPEHDHYSGDDWGYVYKLDAGTSYDIGLHCAAAATTTVTVTKVVNAATITASSDLNYPHYKGDYVPVSLTLPEGTIDCVDVTFSDNSVAQLAYPVDSRENYNEVTLELLKAGTVTVTATTRGGATVTFDLTVFDCVDGGTLTLDTPVDPENGTTRTVYTFNPTETGLYWVTFPAETSYSWNYDGNATETFHFDSAQYSGEVLGMTAGETYKFYISNVSDDNAQLKVIKTQLATGISFDQTSVTGATGDSTKVGFTVSPADSVTSAITVQSDDTSIVNAVWYELSAVDVLFQQKGTANVTITTNEGYSATLPVTVSNPVNPVSGTLTESVASSFNLNEFDKLTLTFTPDATGYYWLKNHNNDGWNHLQVENVDSAFEYDEGNYSGAVYYLTRGTTYTLTENHEEEHSFTVTMESVTTATNVEFEQSTMTVQVGSLIDPTLVFTGGILGTRFNIDNTNVTWQPDGMNAHSCRYLMIGSGTVVITATTVNRHDTSISFAPTCTVTVNTAAYHQQDVEEGTTAAVTLNKGDNAVLEFKPDETGKYFVGKDSGANITHLVIDRTAGNDIGNLYGACDSTRDGNVHQMEAGKTYWIVFTAHDTVTSSFTVEKQIPATGITFNDTDIETNNALTVEKDQETTVYMTMSPAGALDYLQFTSSNPSVAEVVAQSGDSFNIRGYQAGSTTITVTSGGGATRTLEVTVEESTTPPPAEPSFDDQWKIKQAADETVTYVYTPTEDGFFFIGTDPMSGEPLKLNDSSVKSYDWDDSDGWGFVYKLTAGTAYTFENTCGHAREFTMFVKKVEEAQDFTIPATLSGKVGDVIELPFTFTGTLSTNPVSDKEYIVRCYGGNAQVEYLQLLSEGTAVITVTDHHGNVHTCTVTVGAADGILEINDSQFVGLSAGSSTRYYLTPAYSGLKVIYAIGDTPMTVTVQNADGSAVEGSYACMNVGCNAVAANLSDQNKYLITISSDKNVVGEFRVLSAQTATAIETYGNTEAYPTEGDTFTIGYDLLGSGSGIVVDQLTAESSDESIVKVLSVNNTGVTMKAVDGGSATVTVKLTNGESAAFTVNVSGFNNQGSVDVGENTLTLDSEENTRYSFTPTESGTYWICIPEDANVGMWVFVDDTDPGLYNYRASGKNGKVYTLEAQKTYTFNITPSDNATVNVYVAKVTEATDFTINGGKNITGTAGTELTVYLTAGENELIRVNSITSSNEEVFTIGNNQNDRFDVYLAGSGTAELTVTLENGIEKKIQVTVQTYEDQADGFWEDQLEEWDYVEHSFTPDEDGFYFLNYQYGYPAFEIATGGDTPLMSFEYNDRENYTGYVYKLEAGKTYTIRSEWEVSGYYAVYIHKVDEATEFSIHLDEDVEKKVGNNAWLNIQANGVLSHSITSSDETVAVVGSSSPHGSYIYFVGEGTATITVTDHNGNKKTYEVTVKGTAETKELRNDMEIGFAANSSVSYYFTPEDGGLYWIRPNQKAELGISIKKDGASSDETATEWAEEDSSGILVELTAGQKYLVTFTSKTAGTAQIKAEHPETPWSIMLEGEPMRSGFVDDIMTLNYFWEPPMAYSEVTATSSNPAVVQVLGHGKMVVGVKLLSVGEAEVTISTANGTSVSCVIKVRELREETIRLDEEKTVQLSDGEMICYTYTAAADGYVYLWQSNQGMSNLDIYGLDANNDRYSLTHFNHNGQGDTPGGYGTVFQVEAGETYRFCVESRGDTNTTVKLQSIQKATSVTMDKTEISGYPGQNIWVNFEVEPAGSFAIVDAKSANGNMAHIDGSGSDGIGVYLESAGQTQITVEINGETKTIPVTVKEITDVLQPGEENALIFTLDPGETAACLYESTYAGKMYFYGNGCYEIQGAELMDRYEFGNYVSTGSQLGYLYRDTFMLAEDQTYTVLVTNPYDTRMDIVVTTDGLVDMVDMEIVAQDEYQLGEEFEIIFKPVPINSEPENSYELIFDSEGVLEGRGQNMFGASLVALRPGTVTISLEGLGYEDQHTISVVADSIGLDEDKKVTVPYNTQKAVVFTAPEDGFYNITFTAPQNTFAVVETVTPWMSMDPAGDHSISVQMTKGENYVIYYEVRGEGETADVTIRVTDDAPYITKVEILKEPDKKSYFRDYLDQAFTLEGIELQVTWSDGAVEEYSYDRLMQCEDMLGDYPFAYDVAAQNGDTITIAVGTSYQYDTFDITLTDCNVVGFEVLGPANLTIPANAYGAMEGPGWIYSAEFIREFLQFKISFDDGTSVTIPATQANYDGYGLFDSIPNDQYDNLWELNGTYTMLFGFLDFFDEFEVTIVENPVQSIEVLTPPSTEFVFGNEAYGIVEPEGGYTFVPGNYDQYKGLSFKVTYTDGTSETVTPDQFSWPYGSDYGETCFGWYNGFPVETFVEAGYYYGEYELGKYFEEPGTLTVTIRYGWAVDEYTLTLQAPHVHELTEVARKEATCTEDGNIRHWTCSGCDVLFGDAEGKQELSKDEVTLTDANNHSYYEEWVPAEDYHCHKCQLCGYEKDETPHSAFIEKVDLAYLISVNDCVEFYFKQCPDCGRGSDPDQRFTVARTDATHVWDEGTVTTAPTCTAAGEKTYKCTNSGCEVTKTEPVEKLAHNLSETKGKAATCTEEGNINFWTCNDCKTKFADAEGKTEITGSIVLTKTGHVVSKVEAKAATCTEDGNVEYWTCTACKQNFSDKEATKQITDVVQKAAGHKLTHVEAKEASYTAPGNIEYWTCDHCDALFGDAEGKTTVTDVVIPQLIKVEEEKAEVSEGAMDSAIEEALGGSSGDSSNTPDAPGGSEDTGSNETVKEIVLPVKDAASNTTVSSVSLPVSSVEKIVEANKQVEEEVVLTVEMDTATVTLDSKALEAVAEQVGSAEVTLVVEEIKHEDLNEVQQEIVKTQSVEMIISAELVGGNTSVHDFQGGSVTIKLPFEPKEGTKGNEYKILYVADNGKIEQIKTKYVDGHLVFTLNHFSDYVVVHDVQTPESSNPDTGDGMNLVLLTVLMLSSVAAMAALEISKKRSAR